MLKEQIPKFGFVKCFLGYQEKDSCQDEDRLVETRAGLRLSYILESFFLSVRVPSA